MPIAGPHRCQEVAIHAGLNLEIFLLGSRQLADDVAVHDAVLHCGRHLNMGTYIKHGEAPQSCLPFMLFTFENSFPLMR